MKSIVFNHTVNQWVIYTSPVKILKATTHEEVIPVLIEAEKFSTKGYHAVGFCSYEASFAFDSSMKNYPTDDGFPLCYFAIYDTYQILHIDKKQNLENDFYLDWQASITQEQYQKHLQDIRQHLKQGDCYQINFTYRLNAAFKGSPSDYFFHLIQQQKTPLGAYLETEDWAICSVSPELFFSLDDNKIISKPMKGTAARGRYLLEDEENQHWLQQSHKNQAENTMIVDMIRNDLGRIADKGSVKVNALHTIEKYKTALQMTSTVEAHTSASIVEIFKALFPCASITGAPKIKAMEIIHNLESEPRRVYTGSIGYMLPNRQAKFNVAIRTVYIDKIKQKAEFGVGGGIVWDSENKEEYQETMLKSKFLVSQQKQDSIELLETMLWIKDEGIYLMKEHVERLHQSAQYLLSHIDKYNIQNKLQQVCDQLQQQYCFIIGERKKMIRLICRLSDNKNADNEIIVQVKELQPLINPIKLSFSKISIESSDWRYFHKTTDRSFYLRALQCGLNPLADDVIMLNEKKELTETTRFNIVIKKGEKMLTPTLDCGLLNGVFRQHLLNQGEISEARLTVKDLDNNDGIYLINSVRKWQKAEMIETV